MVRLGDLARYRGSELADHRKHAKNAWSHAVGYYDLALEILPDIGEPLHQRGIVAQMNHDFHQTVYYFLRSRCTKFAHPAAEQNLRRAYVKALAVLGNNQHVSPNVASLDVQRLLDWHLKLIIKSSDGKAYKEHDELENEVVHRLAKEVTAGSSDTTCHRIILINMAAADMAKDHFTSQKHDPDSRTARFEAYIYHLRLNLRAFEAILKVLGEGLLKMRGQGKMTLNHPISINSAVDQAMPLVHVYLVWLVKNVDVVQTPFHTEINGLQANLWDQLAKTLNYLTALFDVDKLEEQSFMLQEIHETLSFTPLHCAETMKLWYVDGKRRPAWYEAGEKIEGRIFPFVTTLFRVRQIYDTVLDFAISDSTPVSYETHDGRGRFFTGSCDAQMPSSHSDISGSETKTKPTADTFAASNGSADKHSNASSQSDRHISEGGLTRMVIDIVEPSNEKSTNTTMFETTSDQESGLPSSSDAENILQSKLHKANPYAQKSLQHSGHQSQTSLSSDDSAVTVGDSRPSTENGRGNNGPKKTAQAGVQIPATSPAAAPRLGSSGALRPAVLPPPRRFQHVRVNSNDSVGSIGSRHSISNSIWTPTHDETATLKATSTPPRRLSNVPGNATNSASPAQGTFLAGLGNGSFGTMPGHSTFSEGVNVADWSLSSSSFQGPEKFWAENAPSGSRPVSPWNSATSVNRRSTGSESTPANHQRGANSGSIGSTSRLSGVIPIPNTPVAAAMARSQSARDGSG